VPSSSRLQTLPNTSQCHSKLDRIYETIANNAQSRGWDGVDLVIICGDFQAVRNAQDLNAMSVPLKYRKMGDFHKYYSGEKMAPYLTIFVGGNHEASNYLFELYYGGWVAPNIYYMGAANVVNLAGLRISGLSGIWNGFDFRRSHHERLPYTFDNTKSIYHVREFDLRKLQQIRTQVHIGISHDWPNGIELNGDTELLYKIKPYLVEDSKAGKLNSVAAHYMMQRLRPLYWFSGHHHCKFLATVEHKDPEPESTEPAGKKSAKDKDQNVTMVDFDQAADPVAEKAAKKKKEEEDLDHIVGDDEESAKPDASTSSEAAEASDVPDEICAQLPAAFQKGVELPQYKPRDPFTAYPSCRNVPAPEGIANTTTQFLALGKPDEKRPNSPFLDFFEIPAPQPFQRPLKLDYDAEWLAITRAMASDLQVRTKARPKPTVPRDQGREHYLPLIQAEEAWVAENIVAKGLLTITENFTRVAPVYDPAYGEQVSAMPREFPNPQTESFCNLLQMENKFAISAEEINQRMANVPPMEVEDAVSSRRRRGGYRSRRGGPPRGGREG
jgi:lariat debranching enzyme